MRLKIEYSYLGREYNGSQKQKNNNTIQNKIEDVLFNFFGVRLELVASGRTDAGVSAIKQIGHFDIDEVFLSNKIGEVVEKNLASLVIRLNYLLPDDIRILRVSKVDSNYHARFNAKNKTYAYNFYVSKVEIPYLSQFCLWVKRDYINLDEMKKAIGYIIGTHDFTSFCASNTDVMDKVRTIYDAKIISSPLGYYSIVISGNGFLYNMLRIIVGTLLDVGYDKINSDTFKNILSMKDRNKAGKTVKSDGLVLVDVVN